MIPISERVLLAAFDAALAVGAAAMSWWRHDTDDEDAAIIAANDLVLESLADADTTGKVKNVTGRDWRDQVSVEEAEALNEERELRKFGWKRN